MGQPAEGDRVAAGADAGDVVEGRVGGYMRGKARLRPEGEAVAAAVGRAADQVQLPEGAVEDVVDAYAGRMRGRRVGPQQRSYILLAGRWMRNAPLGGGF